MNSGCSGINCSYSGIINPQTFYQVEIDNGVCPSVFAQMDTVIYSASSVAGNLSTSLDTVCEGVQSPVLTLNGYTGNNFQWQISTDGGINWTNLSYNSAMVFLPPQSDTSWYRVNVKNNFCASVTSNAVEIVVEPSPSVSVPFSVTSIMFGESVQIAATGTGTPNWSSQSGLSSYTTFTTIASPIVTTTYTITVDAGNGCTDQDTVRVIVTPLVFTERISNALTPNGDGINDAFKIENIEAFRDSELSIFNEYGQLVYNSAPYMNDWKGTYNGGRLPDGTYFYVLQFKESKKIYKGNITLISQE
jgi:gliding motility-associated-like protein